MTNREIERKLQRALRENAPDVWEEIAARTGANAKAVEAPALVTTNGEVKTGGRIRASALAALLVILLSIGGLILYWLTPLQTKTVGFGSFFIDINPSIQVTLDEKERADEIIPLNEDAGVLLAKTDLTTLQGKTPTEVTVYIWNLAYDTGYISPEMQNNALLISCALADEGRSERFTAAVKQGLNEVIKEKGVYCTVLTELAAEDTQEAAEEYGITAGKYQLIQRAIALGAEIDEADYADMSVREINEKIAVAAKENNEWQPEELERRYDERYEQAKVVDDAFEKEEDYEEKYDEWLSEIEGEYEQNWEVKVEEWKEWVENGNPPPPAEEPDEGGEPPEEEFPIDDGWFAEDGPPIEG